MSTEDVALESSEGLDASFRGINPYSVERSILGEERRRPPLERSLD